MLLWHYWLQAQYRRSRMNCCLAAPWPPNRRHALIRSYTRSYTEAFARHCVKSSRKMKHLLLRVNHLWSENLLPLHPPIINLYQLRITFLYPFQKLSLPPETVWGNQYKNPTKFPVTWLLDFVVNVLSTSALIGSNHRQLTVNDRQHWLLQTRDTYKQLQCSPLSWTGITDLILRNLRSSNMFDLIYIKSFMHCYAFVW